MLPLRARVDLGEMTMKGYSALPKATALLEPHHQIVVSYPGYSWGSYPSAEMQSVYSMASADWAMFSLICICIYIYTSLRKNKTGHIRIINLFPSCYVFWYKSKTLKKNNRISSDLMDKIIQNRHRKEGWEGDRRGLKSFLLI